MRRSAISPFGTLGFLSPGLTICSSKWKPAASAGPIVISFMENFRRRRRSRSATNSRYRRRGRERRSRYRTGCEDHRRSQHLLRLLPQCQAGRVNLCRNLRAIGIHRDGGFAEYVLVPRKQAFEIPLTLDPVHGAFCEPLACCLHGVDLSGIKAGSTVAIQGGGVIGLLTVQLARLAGATTVILSTRQATKRRLAEEVGATATVDPSAGDVVEAIAGPAGLVPGGVDVVIECAGVAETVKQSTRLAKRAVRS